MKSAGKSASEPGREEHDSSIASEELWKEQLGYVSGTILAWGAVLLQFWPVLARLQTGGHIHALGRDEGVRVTAMSFYLLALLVAVGLGMLIFGSIHVLARGFWLARFLIEPHSRSAVPASERIARATYVVIHLFWVTSLFFLGLIPLSALSALLTIWFSKLGWPFWLARVVASLLAFSPVYAAVIVFYRRRRPGRRPRIMDAPRRVGYRNLAIAYLSLPLLWVIAIEFSYIADLQLPDRVFSRTDDPNIVVSVELGGAVSNPAPARLALTGTTPSGEISTPLRLRGIENGRYVSVLATKSLPAGDYEVTMTYPHSALIPTFPFLRNEIHRTVGFVLVD